MGITLGFVGAGSFGSRFIPIYQDHPEVDHMVLCDLKADLLAQRSRQYGLPDTEPSLDDLLGREDVDAVAIYTQHWLHAPQAIKALEAGKHVTTAVPGAYSVDDCQKLVQTVERTGLVYAIQETSLYYPDVAYARKQHAEGAFGRITYSEARYFHDYSHGLEEVYRRRFGKDWFQKAGDAPMLYVTHSTSGIMSVTGTHATEVACLGVSLEGDEIFDATKPHGNAYANQVALMKMSDGGMARVAEFRRVGHPGAVDFSFYGTRASLEAAAARPWHGGTPPYWCDLEGTRPLDLPRLHSPLPDSLVKYVFGGHVGSHPYLVHDFVTSVVNGLVPEGNVWAAARHNLPGLVAVQSARQDGKWLKVPDCGNPPASPGGKPGVRAVDDGEFQKH